jgi:hypothetical protein
MFFYIGFLSFPILIQIYYIFKSKVKLCYNDHGHNEFTFITNWKLPIWVSNDKLLRKSSRLQRIMDIANFAGPREFVTTQFDWPKNPRVGSTRLGMKNLLDQRCPTLK